MPFQELLQGMLGVPFPVWGTSPGTEPSLGFQSRTNIASVEGTVSSRSVSGLWWEEGKDVRCACHVGVSALPVQPNHQGSCKTPAAWALPQAQYLSDMCLGGGLGDNLGNLGATCGLQRG